jgi:hypothetical protein
MNEILQNWYLLPTLLQFVVHRFGFIGTINISLTEILFEFWKIISVTMIVNLDFCSSLLYEA